MRKPRRTPLVMSAVVLPGAGQFVQHRWLAAAVFGIAFLFCATMFFVHVFRIIAAFYRMGLEFDTYEVPELTLRATAMYFLAAVLVYAAGLLDTWFAYRRACTDWARRKARLPEFPEQTAAS